MRRQVRDRLSSEFRSSHAATDMMILRLGTPGSAMVIPWQAAAGRALPREEVGSRCSSAGEDAGRVEEAPTDSIPRPASWSSGSESP